LQAGAQPSESQPRTSGPRAEAPPAPSPKTQATAAIVSREVALAQRAKPIERAVAPTARPSVPIAIAPEASVGAAATASRTMEVKPLLKEAPPAAAAVQKEPLIAAPPSSSERVAVVRAGPNEQFSAPRPALKEPPAAAVSLPKDSPASDNSWSRRIRVALDACGKPGVLRNDVCREAVRWNHCHPNRWGTVRECTVERFASSGSPE
jgi:hypothetical protein